MKNFDKIISLLENNNLTKDEKNSLNNLLNEDAEAKEFFNSYKKLGSAFLISRHFTIDELGDYVLIKNGLEPENNENAKNIPFFDAHIRRCSKCAEEMKVYNKEFSDMENFLSAQFKPTKEPIIKGTESKITPVFKFNIGRYALLGLSAIVILFFSLMIISNLSTSEYYKLATLGDTSDMSISRGRNTDNFELSIKAIEEKDYLNAIEYLKSDIKLNPKDETIFYSYYILGLTYLETSEKDLLRLFPSFDKSSAESALHNLKKAIELNTSGKFQNVNLDAYFYAAKASLMLEDAKSTKEYLSIVIKEKGSKMNECEKILKELE